MYLYSRFYLRNRVISLIILIRYTQLLALYLENTADYSGLAVKAAEVTYAT